MTDTPPPTPAEIADAERAAWVARKRKLILAIEASDARRAAEGIPPAGSADDPGFRQAVSFDDSDLR